MNDRTNRAIDRLAAALQELSYLDRISINPEIRMLLCPSAPAPEDVKHMHALGLTPRIAELVAEAIEDLIIRQAVGQQPDTAAAEDFARTNPQLAEDIASAFRDIDTGALARTVLDGTAPIDRPTVRRALDAMFRTDNTPQDPQEDGDDA